MTRIRGGLPIVWRSAESCQIGVDPHQHLLVEGLSAEELSACLGLPPEFTPAALYRLRRRANLPPDQLTSLLAKLRTQGAVIDEPLPHNPGDLYWERLIPSASERRARLRARTVALVGEGPLLRLIAMLLAESGIGRVLVDDPQLRRELTHRFPSLIKAASLQEQPDLVITVEPYLIDPIRERSLLEDGLTHLSVVVQEGGVLVGPTLSPASPVCRACLELWSCEEDPLWPVIATQARELPCPDLDPVLLHQSAALAARAALDTLEDAPGTWLSLRMVLSAQSPWGRVEDLIPHPHCLCQQVGRQPTAT